MALIKLSGGTKFLHHNVNLWRILLPFYQKSTKVDAIDSFTTDLVEQKSRKWETIYRAILNRESKKLFGLSNAVATSILRDIQNIQSPDLELNIDQLALNQLDSILYASLKDKHSVDFYGIIEQCLNKKKMPSVNIIFECLEYLSYKGRSDLIEKFGSTLIDLENQLPDHHTNLLIFKGLSYWQLGKCEQALDIIVQAYGHTHTVGNATKKRLQSAFKHIAKDTLTLKSEAILVCLNRTAEKINKDHQDILPTLFVWRNCFDSKWFSDQQLSNKIYNNFAELRSIISERSTFLCAQFIRTGDVDSVYRLIELFLKYADFEACKNCLSLLFDYQYYQNNLKACTEIVKNCTELNIPLSDIQCEKLILLLLNRPTVHINQAIKEEPQYQYKF